MNFKASGGGGACLEDLLQALVVDFVRISAQSSRWGRSEGALRCCDSDESVISGLDFMATRRYGAQLDTVHVRQSYDKYKALEAKQALKRHFGGYDSS